MILKLGTAWLLREQEKKPVSPKSLGTFVIRTRNLLEGHKRSALEPDALLF